jgi:hypothetical protein
MKNTLMLAALSASLDLKQMLDTSFPPDPDVATLEKARMRIPACDWENAFCSSQRSESMSGQ